LQMHFVGVRRPAALDLWGTAGTHRRRKLIRAEFFVGVVGCLSLGVLALGAGSGWLILVGIWLIGAGVNYVPLALEAVRLSKPGTLEKELEDVAIRPELRRAGLHQFWVAVPFAVAAFAIAERYGR